eukprot:TRINITY_DN955_c0_g1_i1.p1 TRINITY_DN955_c0_g1~~TRINITY_DN955_c0_g1_i1.p1  ORF type:complete len:565 (-),score=99.58 TRINITY_DN955_c0_g1_i1:111-1805(-)
MSLDVIEIIEKVHGLITLCIDIYEAVKGNKESAKEMIEKLRRIDAFLKLRTNRNQLESQRPSKALTLLLSSCERALKFVQEFQKQTLISSIAKFSDNQEGFKQLSIDLDQAISDLTFYTLSVSKKTLPDVVDYDFDADVLEKFVLSSSVKLVIWLDPNMDNNKPKILSYHKKDRSLFFKQVTNLQEFSEVLNDPRISSIVTSNTGFFRIRVISNTYFALEDDGNKEPDCVLHLAKLLVNKRIGLLTFGLDKQFVTKAKTYFQQAEFTLGGASTVDLSVQTFCKFGLILWIGESECSIGQIVELQNRGFVVIRFDPKNFAEYTSFDKWAEGLVQEAINNSTSIGSFGVVLSVGNGEDEKLIKLKIRLANDIRENLCYSAVRSNQIHVACLYAESNPLLDEYCLKRHVTKTEESEIISWAVNQLSKPLPYEFSPSNITIIRIEAKNIRAADGGVSSDPYVVVYQNNKEIAKTPTKKKTLNPIWDPLAIPTRCLGTDDKIKLVLSDKDILKDDYLGGVEVELAPDLLEPYQASPVTLSYDLYDINRTGSTKITGKIWITFTWTEIGP